jgi:nicotinamide-nucleotide amidase
MISAKLIALLKKNPYKIVTAESCTGGLLSTYLTDESGSSNWFERGFITYSNEAKKEFLQVKEETLKQGGAVSMEVAREMAIGALENSYADIGISITGIAGPDGGTDDKPVGTVCFGFAGKSFEPFTEIKYFSGDRKIIREQAVQFALRELEEILKNYTQNN